MMENKGFSKLIWFLLLIMCFSYATVRLANLAPAAQKVREKTDTKAYVRISESPITSLLDSARPPAFPLLLKLFAGNHEQVAWAQGILSIVCWSLLAFSVAASMRVSFLPPMAFGFVLLLSLHQKIIGWDATMLTESLSLSLMALLVALWLWLLKGWRWYKMSIMIVVAFIWAFSRDTNAWILLAISVPIVLLVLLQKTEKKNFFIAVSFTAIFYLSNMSADLGGRWVFPFQNVLAQRILTDAQAVNYFSTCGMPVSVQLMDLAGGYANSQDRAFYLDPNLTGYRMWLEENGKSCYVGWLLSRPLQSLGAPFTDFNTLITLKHVTGFFSKMFLPILPAWLETFFFPARWIKPLFVVVNIVALYILFTSQWKQNTAWLVFVGLSLTIFPHYFLIWHGDVIGIYRHAMSVSVQFYLSVWIMVLLAVDSVVNKHYPNPCHLNTSLRR